MAKAPKVQICLRPLAMIVDYLRYGKCKLDFLRVSLRLLHRLFYNDIETRGVAQFRVWNLNTRFKRKKLPLHRASE